MPTSADWAELLTVREQAALHYYTAAFRMHVGTNPTQSPHLVFNLGDSPWERLTWNLASNRLPGFRTNGGKLYHPAIGRWFLHKELLTTMGLPLYRECAEAAHVPLMHTPEASPSKMFLGNMMHVPSVGCMILVALCCARPVG